ncbi:unnamed protein product [Acanthoscelides obtectus]|uniref:C2H2-type domain-containing protein n=1 Tax=Acanthoscelides obtectus TaxID=200917 RepID=A0A9P0PGT5_ACAOB|nr:unnamed protein product [Acanthoscelides obtectus]CAK1676171.1 Zinc finger protein 26 [Acanthoscelides obtectus]
MKPKSDFESDNKPFIKSEDNYPDYEADHESKLGEFQSVTDENWDGVNQAKTENQLAIEVKSEKPDRERSMDNMMFENMNTSTRNEEFEIKYEYDEDAGSDSTWDRIKAEQKLEPVLEGDWRAEPVDQTKMEFQEFEKLEEKPPLNFENTDALELHQEFDIKTESDQNDGHESVQMKKSKIEHRYSQIQEEKQLFSCYICNYSNRSKRGLIIHIKRNNCYLGSSLGKSKSVSRSLYQLNKYVCMKCDEVFKSKMLLDNHVIRKHVEYIASVSSKIHHCTFCDYKTVIKRYLTGHMIRHTNTKVSDLHFCKHCNMAFKAKQSHLDHILNKHPNFSGTVSRKIYECVDCQLKTTRRSTFMRHMTKHNSQKPFDCIKCDASFKTKQGFDDHTLQKHAELIPSGSHKILECTQCEYKTAYTYCLSRHIMNHTRAKLTCATCDASLMNKFLLDNHILQKHPELTASVSRKVLECTQCEYKTTVAYSLVRHIMKHTPAKLTCTKCDASFTRKPALDNHILRKHPEFTTSVSRKIHECTHCEYKTTYVRCLAMHMMRHTGAKLPCTKCDAVFASKRSLDHHILRQHPESAAVVSTKTHNCTYCEFKTTKAIYLAGHMIKHTGGNVTCTKCDASFASKQSLDNHILQKHPELTASVSHKIHKCTYCQYKTVYASALYNHTTKHTGAKYTCTKCDASFIYKRTLDNHMLQKHPEFTASVSSKIHECTHCGYKTTHVQHLADHIVKHTGVKFSCAKCDALFMCKRTLDYHISRKHHELTGFGSFSSSKKPQSSD